MPKASRGASALSYIIPFESEWSPALGKPFRNALGTGEGDDRLDIGCVAAHGYFHFDREGARYEMHRGGKPATAFLFKLISQLQFSGTVPMIDVQAYAEWLSKEAPKSAAAGNGLSEQV